MEISLKDLVKQTPLCKAFTDEEKELFASMNHSILKFNKGDYLIRKGRKFSYLYLLIKGSLLVTKNGDNVILAHLIPGAIFGEMSFFTKKPRHTNVIADSDVIILKMDDDFFDKITPEMRDKIKNYFIELLINRLDFMNY